MAGSTPTTANGDNPLISPTGSAAPSTGTHPGGGQNQTPNINGRNINFPSLGVDKSAALPAEPDQAATSVSDSGLSKRPRDARLLHLVLANAGVHAYQERVPLQLLDFAYRYTSGVLSDAWQLTSNGYGLNKNHAGNIPGTTAQSGLNAAGSATGGGGGNSGDKSSRSSANTSSNPIDGSHMTVPAIRLAIASRPNYQFQSGLSKDWWMELAAERNKNGLPRVDRQYGVRLPHERFCLTGVDWSLKESWESDEEEEDEDENGDAKLGEDGFSGLGGDDMVMDIDHEMEDVDMDDDMMDTDEPAVSTSQVNGTAVPPQPQQPKQQPQTQPNTQSSQSSSLPSTQPALSQQQIAASSPRINGPPLATSFVSAPSFSAPAATSVAPASAPAPSPSPQLAAPPVVPTVPSSTSTPAPAQSLTPGSAPPPVSTSSASTPTLAPSLIPAQVNVSISAPPSVAANSPAILAANVNTSAVSASAPGTTAVPSPALPHITPASAPVLMEGVVEGAANGDAGGAATTTDVADSANSTPVIAQTASTAVPDGGNPGPLV